MFDAGFGTLFLENTLHLSASWDHVVPIGSIEGDARDCTRGGGGGGVI